MIGDFERCFTSVGGSLETTKRDLLNTAKRNYEQKCRSIEKSYLCSQVLQMALQEPASTTAHKVAEAVIAGYKEKYEPKPKKSENDIALFLLQAAEDFDEMNDTKGGTEENEARTRPQITGTAESIIS